MKVNEAITLIWGTALWARPISWKGQRCAISYGSDNGIPRLMQVPGNRGGVPWMPYGPELWEEWEVLTSTEVLAGR